MGWFARWVNTESVSASSDLRDEPALAWRSDLPERTTGPVERWRRTAGASQWSACLLAACVAPPLAIVAAFYKNTAASGVGMILLVVVLAPLIEESLKGAAAIYLAEFRPWLVPTGTVLVAITLVSGLGFAAIENLWYLEVLIDDPSEQIVRIRWIAGPIVHGGGALIVGVGATRMWRRAMRLDRSPEFADVRPWIAIAAIWHGAYNALAITFEFAGYFD